MRVTVVRSGGFAGLRAEADVDTTTEPDGRRIEAAVAALTQREADGATERHSGGDDRSADRYSYRLHVDDAMLLLRETELTDEGRWLVGRVLGTTRRYLSEPDSDELEPCGTDLPVRPVVTKPADRKHHHQPRPDGLLRIVNTCDNTEDGVREARSEGDPPTGDEAVDTAYENLGVVWDMFAECLDRHSIDDDGLPLVAFVHYGRAFDNAFWNGEYMVVGDGSPGGLRDLYELTVIAHELGHALVDETLELNNYGQAGSLAEHLGDVVGSMAKQWKLGQTAEEADWLIGEGIYVNRNDGPALRSMRDPGAVGRRPQPEHADDLDRHIRDNLEVHRNVGIPNRAFQLAAVEIGGHAYHDALRIWYHTMTHADLRRNCRFKQFAAATVESATELYGPDSRQVAAVRGAWETVGVLTVDEHADREADASVDRTAGRAVSKALTGLPQAGRGPGGDEAAGSVPQAAASEPDGAGGRRPRRVGRSGRGVAGDPGCSVGRTRPGRPAIGPAAVPLTPRPGTLPPGPAQPGRSGPGPGSDAEASATRPWIRTRRPAALTRWRG